MHPFFAALQYRFCGNTERKNGVYLPPPRGMTNAESPILFLVASVVMEQGVYSLHPIGKENIWTIPVFQTTLKGGTIFYYLDLGTVPTENTLALPVTPIARKVLAFCWSRYSLCL